MKIIKETSRKVGKIEEYRGICDSCATPLDYEEELIVIEILNNEQYYLLVPVDRLVCPYCSHEISLIRVFKNLDISRELETIKHEQP